MTARTLENITMVGQAVIRSPEKSARRHARELRLSRESVRTILKKDLTFHPYKMCIVQQLKAIKQEVAAIDHKMLDRSHTAFLQRIESCIQANGQHLSDIIFHS